jgi:hypothetical protein
MPAAADGYEFITRLQASFKPLRIPIGDHKVGCPVEDTHRHGYLRKIGMGRYPCPDHSFHRVDGEIAGCK